MLKKMFAELGPLYSVRNRYQLTTKLKKKLLQKLRNPPTTFNGLEVKQIIDLDGSKLLLENGSWFLMRFSGTEPVVRCYGEASSRKELRTLMDAGRRYIFEP